MHNETIIPIALNPMWGTDATATWMQQQGQVIVIAVLDHFAGECLGIHVAKYGSRHEAWSRFGRRANVYSVCTRPRWRTGSLFGMTMAVSMPAMISRPS